MSDTEQQVGTVDATGNWTPPAASVRVDPPPGDYRLHIKSVDQKPTKAGMPMDSFVFEIVSPETASIDGQNCSIVGTEVRHWNSYQLSGKGAALLGNAIDFAADLGANLGAIRAKGPQDYVAQLQKQTALLSGMTVTATIVHEPREKMRALTPEQKALGEKPTPELDANGRPVIAGVRLIIKQLHKGTAKRSGGR